MQAPGMMQPNPYAMMNHQRQAVGMPPMQGGGQPETFQMTQPGMPSAVTQQPSPAANAVPNPAAQNQIGNQQAMPNAGTPASGTPNPQANQIPPQQQQQQQAATQPS